MFIQSFDASSYNYNISILVNRHFTKTADKVTCTICIFIISTHYVNTWQKLHSFIYNNEYLFGKNPSKDLYGNGLKGDKSVNNCYSI